MKAGGCIKAGYDRPLCLSLDMLCHSDDSWTETCCICPAHMWLFVHVQISTFAFVISTQINPFWLIALISVMDPLKLASVSVALGGPWAWNEWNVSFSASCGKRIWEYCNSCSRLSTCTKQQLILSKLFWEHLQPSAACFLHIHTKTQLTLPTSFLSSRAHTVQQEDDE